MGTRCCKAESNTGDELRRIKKDPKIRQPESRNMISQQLTKGPDIATATVDTDPKFNEPKVVEEIKVPVVANTA